MLLALLGLGAACGPESCCAPPPSTGTGVGVINAAVRACDLLFQVPGEEVPSVTFGAGVRGEAVPKAPRLGVSFVARADATLENQDILTLVYTRETVAAELVSYTCFDAAGAPVTGDVLRLSE